jgi:hypothetical protein
MENPFFAAAMRVFPYLAFSFTSRLYPNGELMDDEEASNAKAELYEYLFSGRSVAWPPGSKQILHIADNPQDEPAFPYLVLLLRFDAASFMSMLNEAFEDPFLNEADEESQASSIAKTNGLSNRAGYKMTRQHIVSILLDVVDQNGFDPEERIYLDIFIARSLPKYPAQLVLSGSLLNKVLQRLCEVPSEELREDCQLSAEYLLSAYQPPDTEALITSLRQSRFFRVLKTVYRRQQLYPELLEIYFEDEEDKNGVFDCIASCLLPGAGLPQKQMETFKRSIVTHASDLAEISTVQTARILFSSAVDLLEPVAKALQDSYQQFMFLRTLLEPKLIREETSLRSQQQIPEKVRHTFQERYVQLMCAHEPGHVADYVSLLQSGDLRLDRVLPAMEESGVIDAAVVLLARDGLARDAMDRLVAHVQSQQHALVSLIEAAGQSPDAEATRETANDLIEAVQKYTKVGIWLCQGQTAATERRPRPRGSLAKDIDENELDIDEFLWLNLIDTAVQVTKETSSALQILEDHPSESEGTSLDPDAIRQGLRSNVQQAFTALLAATAAQIPKNPTDTPQHHQQPATSSIKPHQNNLSFLRILRAFLTRAATTAPSLSDLRSVLADIFSATDLLGGDVFAKIQDAHARRQRGWRPRTQACDLCKRRAWGSGIGEVVWGEWVGREQAREHAKAEKALVRTGGEEARRRSRGKAKVSVAADPVADAVEDIMGGEDRTRLALVVFACRHVFHRVCLDKSSSGRDGGEGGERGYKCPVCVVK